MSNIIVQIINCIHFLTVNNGFDEISSNCDSENGIVASNQSLSDANNFLQSSTNSLLSQSISNDKISCTNNSSKRKKCFYASNCYRINLQHKQKFSHPENDDYDDAECNSNINNGKKAVYQQYGVGCYRKNEGHKQNFFHPSTFLRITRNKQFNFAETKCNYGSLGRFIYR